MRTVQALTKVQSAASQPGQPRHIERCATAPDFSSRALSNAHVLTSIVRLYGFDQILLHRVSKLTRSIESINSQVTVEFRSSDIKLRHVRIFANDEGIYLAPGWKYATPIEKTTFDFLIKVLNSTYLLKRAQP